MFYNFYNYFSDSVSMKNEVMTFPKARINRGPDTKVENSLQSETNNSQYPLDKTDHEQGKLLEIQNQEHNQSSLLNQYGKDNDNNRMSNRTYESTNELQEQQSKIDQSLVMSKEPNLTTSSPTNKMQAQSKIDQSKPTIEINDTIVDDDKMDVDDVIIDDVIKHRNDAMSGGDFEFINSNDTTTTTTAITKAFVPNENITTGELATNIIKPPRLGENTILDARRLLETADVIGGDRSLLDSNSYNAYKYASSKINISKQNNKINSTSDNIDENNNIVNINNNNNNVNNTNSIGQPLKSLLSLVHANSELNNNNNNKKSSQESNTANSSDQTCTYSNVLRNATLKGNLNSGKFTDRGDMDDINQCVRLCCMLKACDLAFMLENKCFTVQCKSKALCEPVQARSTRFSPLICYVLVKATSG